MKIDSDLLEQISLVLKRKIQSGEEGDTLSFVDFKDSDIAEIRLLESMSGVLAISYIRFRLTGDIKLSLAISYYGTVIQQGVPVYDWVREN